MDDELIAYGDTIKATALDGGAVKLAGYLIRFGDPDSPDLAGDYFTKNTDFGDATQSDSWFNHRLPVKLRKLNKQVAYTDPLPKASLSMDDIGVFAEVVIEARNEYEKTIAELGVAGKLAWSSGTAPHLVDRKSVKDGVYEITRWRLGLDASLTPTPAEFRNTNQVVSIKSLLSPDTALPDKDEIKPTKPLMEKKKMENDEIKSAVDSAVAAALAKRDAEIKSETEKQAALKAAEEAGYKKAVDELKTRKAPAFNTQTELGFSEEKDAVPAFKHWVQTGQVNGALITPDASYSNVKAAFNQTTGASGGYLVPDPLYSQIIAKRNLASWVRQLPVQFFSTEADHLLVPVEDTSHTAFVLTAEAGAYNEDEGTVAQKDLILYKYTKMIKASEEFMMNQATNFDSWLTNALARAEAVTENTIFTTGTGSSQPQGVVTGATVANTTATTDVILPAELTALFGYLGAGYNVPSECGLLMANTTKWYLAGQTGNPFLYTSTPAGSITGDQLLGYKVVVDDDVVTYTTASAKCIVFGNFNYFGVVEKPGMVVQRNPYLYMANGQVGIFANIFRGSAVLQSEAFYYLTNHS